VDRVWAAERLRAFVLDIDRLTGLFENGDFDEINKAADDLMSLDAVMRDLMNAARPGLGNYASPMEIGQTHYRTDYWERYVKPVALRAIGSHTLGAEARRRMRPDSPDLVADQFHPWVWDAAAPLWEAGTTQEAVHAAARSVNAHLQHKLGRRDRSESALCREAFSPDEPKSGRPRLRFPGDRTSDTWRSRQQGGMDFGAGCFEGIRNPAAHEDGLSLPEQVALEQLAAFSVLARWIDECTVERGAGAEDAIKESRHLERHGQDSMA
jgi:hypothetical protein